MKEVDDDNNINGSNDEVFEDPDLNQTNNDIRKTVTTEISLNLNEKGDKFSKITKEKVIAQILSQTSKHFHEINLPDKIHCPECGSNLFIRITNLSTFEIEKNCSKCKNVIPMRLIDFISELMDAKPPNCEICNENQNKLYKCQCGKNICEKCENKHIESEEEEDKHSKIDFSKKDYECPCSELEFNYYCTRCKKNLCLDCVDNHEEHKNEVINLLMELPQNEEIEKKKKKLEVQKENIKKIIEELDKWINDFIKRINYYKL